MQQSIVKTEDLKNQLRAAQARQRDLQVEGKTIEADIAAAAKTAARQRAEAARHGEDVASVAADLDLDHLRRRREELPYELWSARITTAQLARDLHRAELEEATVESQRTAADYDRAKRELAAAEKAHGEAYSRHLSVGSRLNRLRSQIREDGKRLQQLEEDAPGVA